MLSSTFIEAAFILVREGAEAVLVLAALAAYLSRVGGGERLAALYSGAGAAVLASIAGAWVLARFFDGAHNDLMEGVLILLAAGLMFYVSGWLMVRQDPKAWTDYLRQHSDRVAEGGSALAVAGLAFLAVFREGAETVLFLNALAKTSGGWTLSLIAGIGAAGVAVVVLFVIVRRTTRRLPLRPLFVATSAFLFVMGLKFVGEALQEFQEQTLVAYDPAPHSDWLAAIGLNPTWEALVVQAVIIVLAAGSLLRLRLEARASSAAG